MLMFRSSCWPRVPLLLAVSLLLLTMIPIVQSDIMCEQGSSTLRHVVGGQGFCYSWKPPENPYGCCLFCDQMDAMVSQVVPKGGQNPFSGDRYTEPACCCYNSGVFVDGGDGTAYFSG